MSFLSPSDDLWKRISTVVEDEGFVVYDVERLGASSLRLSIARTLSGSKPRARFDAPIVSDEYVSGDAGGEKDSNEADENSTTHASTQAGVSIGDCTRVCRRLMVVFAAEGNQLGISAEPSIEVSSPGVNRALRLPVHFQHAIGERVRMVVRDQIAAFRCEQMAAQEKPDVNAPKSSKSVKKKITSGTKQSAAGNLVVGELSEIAEGSAMVCEEESGDLYRIPLPEVKRANVDFRF